MDRNKKKRTGESQQFHLLHISLLREYLDQEFVSLKDRIPFEYNPERVYDDFVLMCFLVGNDFVPTLPGLGTLPYPIPRLSLVKPQSHARRLASSANLVSVCFDRLLTCDF